MAVGAPDSATLRTGDGRPGFILGIVQSVSMRTPPRRKTPNRIEFTLTQPFNEVLIHRRFFSEGPQAYAVNFANGSRWLFDGYLSRYEQVVSRRGARSVRNKPQMFLEFHLYGALEYRAR